MSTLKQLEKKINYTFKNKKLLEQAMTHSSYANENKLKRYESNERLEFLGDAVLELVSSEYLYINHPKVLEGELTKTRAGMVCESALAHCAGKVDLGSYLLLGKGEENTGGRFRDSITSDSLEALIGAIFLDGGFTQAKEFIEKFVLDKSDNITFLFDNKTILQEIAQGRGYDKISYHVLSEDGPDHDKSFNVEVKIGQKTYGQGTGKTKKAAEQEAAHNAVSQLEETSK